MKVNSVQGEMLAGLLLAPVGPFPARIVPGLMERLLWQPACEVVCRLGDRYHAAGCPVELCDYAAARDVWNAINKVAT